jgi:transposase
LGISISLGAIPKIIDRASSAITLHYEAIGQAARSSQVNHIDETSYSKKNVLQWLWVMTNTMVAFFMIHPNRSKEAFRALIGDWVGILVSDGYGLYRKWVGLRQTCLAHLIRKAREISEKTDPELARFGKWALSELQRLCHMAEVRPTPGQWRAFYARFIRLITLNRNRKDAAGPVCPPSGKRACLPVTLFGERGRGSYQQPRRTNPALRRAVAKALPGYRQ